MNSLLSLFLDVASLGVGESEVTWWYPEFLISEVIKSKSSQSFSHFVPWMLSKSYELREKRIKQLPLAWEIFVFRILKQVFADLKLLRNGFFKKTHDAQRTQQNSRRVPSLGVHPSRVAQCLSLISHQTFDRRLGEGRMLHGGSNTWRLVKTNMYVVYCIMYLWLFIYV